LFTGIFFEENKKKKYDLDVWILDLKREDWILEIDEKNKKVRVTDSEGIMLLDDMILVAKN
jgi:hypothetical protein